MPSHAVLRLVDAFFRRPLLNLLPLVLLTVLGGTLVATQEQVYQADGVLLVEDETLLASLTEVRAGQGTWQTPAGYTSQRLNSLLETDAFVDAVAETAGLGEAEALVPAQLDDVRSSVTSWDSGENLLRVRATHARPEVAHRLTEATIESLIEWQIDAEVTQSTAAEGFLEPLTERYAEELEDARTTLQDYLEAHPASERGGRPATQQLVVDELTAEVAAAGARYTDAVAKEESARLATAQAESDVRNRLRLLDAPEAPVSPEGGLRSALLGIATFMVVGALLSAGLVVAGALVDRSARFPIDLRRRLGVEVLAVLPDVSAPGTSGPEATGPATGEPGADGPDAEEPEADVDGSGAPVPAPAGVA